MLQLSTFNRGLWGEPASVLTETGSSSPEISLLSVAKMIAAEQEHLFKTAGIWATQRKLHIVTLLKEEAGDSMAALRISQLDY